MKAVILAAGEGTRLRPITATRPKHLIEIAGKTLLEHCLVSIKVSGINEVVIVVHYMGDMIRSFFAERKDLGLKIEYVEQENALGTGDAVGVAEPYVKDDFLVVNGDLLFTPDAVKSVVDSHKKEGADATIAAVPVKNPENYGILELEGKRVKSIVEKPTLQKSPSNLANAGIYVFSPEIFQKLKRTSASQRGELEIPDALSMLISEGKRVSAVRVKKENWIDVGRPWDLLEANDWILTKMKHAILGQVENGANLFGPVTVADTARIRSGAYVEGPTYIGEESDIGPNCFIRACTSIGRKVRIGNACEVKNSIIMDNAHVGHLSYVGDSVICEKCNLGAGTITANYRLDAGSIRMMVKDELIYTGRRKLGVVMGDNVKTGIGTLLMPGVKVGNDCWIGPNVNVNRDLPAQTSLILRQDTKQSPR